MKKVMMIASVIALTAVSCAKDRTCTCTQTNSANATSTTTSVIQVESTKGQAKANCLSTKETTTNGVTWTNTCELS
jgi:predicted outer membrane protein